MFVLLFFLSVFNQFCSPVDKLPVVPDSINGLDEGSFLQVSTMVCRVWTHHREDIQIDNHRNCHCLAMHPDRQYQSPDRAQRRFLCNPNAPLNPRDCS